MTFFSRLYLAKHPKLHQRLKNALQYFPNITECQSLRYFKHMWPFVFVGGMHQFGPLEYAPKPI